jgi:ribulose-phosphate 3-epimerase
MKIQVAPSILSADFSKLGAEVRRAEEAGADMIHVDVMDGHFVDNLTVGPIAVEAARRHTRLPLDVHLMIMNPERHIASYLDAGADSVTFHIEAMAYEYARKRGDKGYSITFHSNPLIDFGKVNALIDLVHKRDKRVGMAINPTTIVETLEGEVIHRVDMILAMTVWPGFAGQSFIEECVKTVRFFRRLNPRVDIEVDGGIDAKTAPIAARAGANVFVAGTATYRAPDMRKAVEEIRRSAEGAFVAKPA